MKPTKAKRKAAALRASRWRKANPERARQHAANYRAKHPLTPEKIARKAEVNRAWRAKNRLRLKAEQQAAWAARKDEANARRRARYALIAEALRIRRKAWRDAHPEHNREFYRRHREKFTGNGPWSNRTYRLKRAWRQFTHTCAANRRQGDQHAQA